MSRNQSLWLTMFVMFATLPLYIFGLALMDLYDYLDTINPRGRKNVCEKISNDLVNVAMMTIHLACFWNLKETRSKFSYKRRMAYQ